MNIKVGDTITLSRKITGSDVENFASITGDLARIHLDEDFAKAMPFNGRIVHGMLLAGLISAAISKLPGVVIYVSQSLHFLKPARVDDSIEITIIVLDKIDGRGKFRLKTECKNSREEILVTGEAEVRVFNQPVVGRVLGNTNKEVTER